MGVIHIQKFEKYKKEGYMGVFVGGCVNRGEGSSFRAQGHAHCFKGSTNEGWICVRSKKRLFMANGKPSRLLWHELAHILSKAGHTDKWRAKMKELGQPLEARYKKKKRLAYRVINVPYFLPCGKRYGWVKKRV